MQQSLPLVMKAAGLYTSFWSSAFKHGVQVRQLVEKGREARCNTPNKENECTVNAMDHAQYVCTSIALNHLVASLALDSLAGQRTFSLQTGSWAAICRDSNQKSKSMSKTRICM